MAATGLDAMLRQLQTSAREARETADTLYERARDVEKRVVDAVENRSAVALTDATVVDLTGKLQDVQKSIDSLAQQEDALAKTLDGISSLLGSALAIAGL